MYGTSRPLSTTWCNRRETNPVHTIPNNIYTMAGKRTVDIRLAFEQFDMMPGAAGKKFQRNLLLNGGSADTQGFSITDCFLRLDDYAVQNGQPTTMPPPAGVLGVTWGLLSSLGGFVIRIRIPCIAHVSCMYLACILMCPVHIHQDTSRYIEIHLYRHFGHHRKCILPRNMYPSLRYV